MNTSAIAACHMTSGILLTISSGFEVESGLDIRLLYMKPVCYVCPVCQNYILSIVVMVWEKYVGEIHRPCTPNISFCKKTRTGQYTVVNPTDPGMESACHLSFIHS